MKTYTAKNMPLMTDINKMPTKYMAASTFSGCGGASVGLKMAGFKIGYANEFVPIARKTYEANATKSTFVDGRDIRKVKVSDILKACKVEVGQLDLLEGSPPCFVAGTLVATKSRGYVPIETISLGDEVLTHRNRFKSVKEVMVRKYHGDLYTIRASFGEPITSTPEHPFLAKRRTTKKGWRKGVSKSKWTDAKDLGVGDYICIGRTAGEKIPTYGGIELRRGINRFNGDVITTENSNTLDLTRPEFWYLIGRWLGDGWIRLHENSPDSYAKGKAKKPRHATYICCDRTDGDTELNEILACVTALGWDYKIRKRRTAYRVIIGGQYPGNKETCIFVQKFGRGAANKFVPCFVHTLPESLQRAFLKGYLDADGHRLTAPKATTHQYRYSSISRNLVYGISELASRVLGTAPNKFVVNYHNTNMIEGRLVDAKPIWTARFNAKPTATAHSFKDDDGNMWVPIREISVKKRKCNVYNLDVSKDHTYTANGIVVHNCKAFSAASAHKKTRLSGEEVMYSEGIKQRVDDLFFEFTRILKGVKPKVFIAENVAGLTMGQNRGFFHEIFESMEKCGYVVHAAILDPSYLGVPQVRKRLIYVGVRKDLVEKYKVLPVFPKTLKIPRLSVRDMLPYVSHIKVADAFQNADIPSPTIVARDSATNLNGEMSSGAFIQTEDGEVRKYTIPELKKIFGMPKDFKLLADRSTVLSRYAQRFERLGRIHVPLEVYYIGATIAEQILSKIPKGAKYKP